MAEYRYPIQLHIQELTGDPFAATTGAAFAGAAGAALSHVQPGWPLLRDGPQPTIAQPPRGTHAWPSSARWQLPLVQTIREIGMRAQAIKFREPIFSQIRTQFSEEHITSYKSNFVALHIALSYR